MFAFSLPSCSRLPTTLFTHRLPCPRGLKRDSTTTDDFSSTTPLERALRVQKRPPDNPRRTTDLETLPRGYPRPHNAEHGAIVSERSNSNRRNEHHRTGFMTSLSRFASRFDVLTCLLVVCINLEPCSSQDRSIFVTSSKRARLGGMSAERTRPRRSITVDGRYFQLEYGWAVAAFLIQCCCS